MAQQRMRLVPGRQAGKVRRDRGIDEVIEMDDLRFAAREQPSARLGATAQRLAYRVGACPVQAAQDVREADERGAFDVEVAGAIETGLRRQPFVIRSCLGSNWKSFPCRYERTDRSIAVITL